MTVYEVSEIWNKKEGPGLLRPDNAKGLNYQKNVGTMLANPMHKKVPNYFTQTSPPKLRTKEQEQVLPNLKENWYPDRLSKKCLNNKTKPRQSEASPPKFMVLPYVKDTSNRLGRVLQTFHI